MADRRKLQGEIDKCLKKVTEGVDLFEDTWKKLQVTNNSNQKDKYEVDLKKEIKKLQRLRDQIKTWLTSSDIKDKQNLFDTKKLIETQMERFKVVEKEAKIKAYSKEGLGAPQKVDPAQREHDETCAWLTNHVEKLNIEIDVFESEIEAINASLKKKKTDKEKLDRRKRIEDSQSYHKYHVAQLEALLRMLDNGTVEVDQIKQIQDDVDHYCENSQDQDFEGNDYMYVDLNLESYEDFLARQRVTNQPPHLDLRNGLTEEESSVISNSSLSTTSDSRSETPRLENVSSEDNKSTVSNDVQCSPLTFAESAPVKCVSSEISYPHLHNDPTVINSQASSTLYASVATALPTNQFNGPKETTSSSSSLDSCNQERKTEIDDDIKPVQNSSPPNHFHGNPNHLSNSCEPASTPANSIGGGFPHQNMDSSFLHNFNDQHDARFCDKPSVTKSDMQMSTSVIHSNDDIRSFVAMQSMDTPLPVIPSSAHLSLESLNERNSVNNRLNNNAQSLSLPPVPSTGFEVTHNSYGGTPGDIFSAFSMQLNSSPPKASANINISQVFGCFPENSFTESQRHTFNVLSAAQKHMPLPMDSQRRRYARPGGPAFTPDYYPSTAPKGNTIDFFKQLSNETLFFIFYYFEGTKAQYFAAKALKTKSWRFHTMFMMWFQRHEQPNNVTDEFEQGTYVYFDYEKWKEQKKEGFTFEYKYLEDKDLIEN